MTSAGRLNVAILSHDPESRAGKLGAELAAGLRGSGHGALLVTALGTASRSSSGRGDGVLRVPRIPEGPLRARGFTGSIAHVPVALAAMAGRRFDVLHALTPVDAVVGQLHGRINRAPVLFTSVEPPSRSSFAQRRLSFALNSRAYVDSDLVIAAGEEVRAAIDRWLAISVQSIEGADCEEYEKLYRSV